METLAVELSIKEIMDLKMLYGEYMHNPVAAERYTDEYQYLIDLGITINDLPKYIYSKKQLKFIDEVHEETGLDIDYLYSGRHMYGDVCPSIVVDNIADFSHSDKYLIDNMGLGWVIYARY